jgi:hypothetical protein
MNIKMLTAWSIAGLLLSAADGWTAEPARFVQDRFAIGFWVDPPADEKMDARYAEIAEANFTMVIGGFGAATPATVVRQLECCAKHDLKAVVSRAGLSADKLPTGPACWGYSIVDEPGAGAFAGIRTIVDEIRSRTAGQALLHQSLPGLCQRGAARDADLRRARAAVHQGGGP